jgi:hypothetical protein
MHNLSEEEEEYKEEIYIYNVKEKEHWGKELFQYLNDMSSSGSKIIKILSFALSFFT